MLHLDKQERLRHRYQTQIQPGHRLGLDVYRDLLAHHMNGSPRVLDVGCGPAGLVAEYAPLAGQVVGVDQYLTNFAEFDGQFGINALAESPIAALPFPDDSFDVVACSWVLEHLDNPAADMAEIARVLAPGGVFLFITPNALNYVVGLRRLVPASLSKGLVKRIYGRDEDFINPTYYRMNTPHAVDRLCAGVGLEREKLHIISDPTYLAVNELAFQLSIVVERLLMAVFPQGGVHLVGAYRKPL